MMNILEIVNLLETESSLYKALSDGAKPQFSTIMKVLKAVGGQIRVNPIPA